MEDCISQKKKSYQSKLVKPIILLTRPENYVLRFSDYIDHKCYNTSEGSTSKKVVINI